MRLGSLGPGVGRINDLAAMLLKLDCWSELCYRSSNRCAESSMGPTTILDFNHEEFNSEGSCADLSLPFDEARCDQAPRRVQPASSNKANRGSNPFVWGSLSHFASCRVQLKVPIYHSLPLWRISALRPSSEQLAGERAELGTACRRGPEPGTAWRILHWSNEISTFLFFECPTSACKPKIVRVHTFWKIEFLLLSNEISTFFDLLMDQGAHFVTVHAFGSIFGESHFLHWSNEISTILIFRSIFM